MATSRRSNLINTLNLAASNINNSNSNNFLNDHITNLSPSILVNSSNEAKPAFQIQNLVTRTSSAPVTIGINQTNQQQINNKETENSNQTDSNAISNKTGALNLGDYLLFEPQTVNDSFGVALNLKSNEYFNWKKFERIDYMKKMHSYFLMSGSDKIFGFKEIIHDNNTSTSPIQYIYVIYNKFYGDLHSYMKEKKRLDEVEARHIFSQCVEAVDECHQNGIIVRDIKLKKFVFTDAEKTKIALTNPEDCLILDDDAEDDLIKSQQGCPAYVSPEVLNTNQSKYSGKLSDSWSLGIVLFTLLLGRYPFHHQTITAMFAKIARGKFQIPPSTGLSLDAKTLLRSLIRIKPEERLLPSQIHYHNWFKNNDTIQQMHNKFKNLNAAKKFLSNLSSSAPILINNNIYNNKPLGISRSSPIATACTSDQFNQSVQSSLSSSSGQTDDDMDRMVPQFIPS